MTRLRKWLFGGSNELETYVREATQRYNLEKYPLLASNRKAKTEEEYTEPE